ncbi:MAG: amidohydrolase family protein [Actinomycetota bacterium]|nr:amidohydrolase family protein [Actinomycetota bacterium]
MSEIETKWGPGNTYAGDVIIHDADSHLMEPNDWLASYADGATAGKLAELSLAGGGGQATNELVDRCWERRDDAEETARLAADAVNGPKGYFAYGSMDSHERIGALDQLGFARQLVFSTFAPSQFQWSRDIDLVYGGASAHNRGMADFCSIDDRLLAVGLVPLSDPRRAVACAREAIEFGCNALWIPHGVPAETSPTHPDYDPLWATLQDAGVPMVLHLGANGGNQLPRTYHNNGRDPGKDFVGGGENLRSKDFLNLFHDAENLLSCMVLDGTFEQFPGLKCGVIELGAGWVPNLMRSLDLSIRAFGRNEPELEKLTLAPSEYLRRQVRFTPWHFEDAGWLVRECGPEMFLFSSDWPHPEGGRDPIREFSSSLSGSGIDPSSATQFWHGNFASLFSR